MEGVYRFKKDSLSLEAIRGIYDQKAVLYLCSFSNIDALKEVLLWGHYANGFKGIAIEVELGDDWISGNASQCVDRECRPVEYMDNVPCFGGGAENAEGDPKLLARRILTSKLKPWSYEQEYRLFVNGGVEADCTGRLENVGKVVKVYCGNPYADTVNAKSVEGHEPLRGFRCRVESIRKVCEANGIGFEFVRVNGALVTPDPQGNN